MATIIRRAAPEDASTVSGILTEAARWLTETGRPLWREDELQLSNIIGDVTSGQFFIAECDGSPEGVVRFQLEDERFWPEVPVGESTYIHRLAVSRQFGGCGIASALLDWAVGRTRELHRTYLRLDCEATRPKLRAIYANYGFRHHSDRQVGAYFVSRYEFVV